MKLEELFWSCQTSKYKFSLLEDILAHDIESQGRDSTGVPDNFGAFLMQIPLTMGLPMTPSNLITIKPSSLTGTLMSTNCNGLLAPTMEKMSKSDKTCHFNPQEEEFNQATK